MTTTKATTIANTSGTMTIATTITIKINASATTITIKTNASATTKND
jgi:hypothetical protein